MVRTLSRYLNLWKYQETDDCIISADLDISRIYKISEAGTISFWSETELDIGNSPIMNFNSALPDQAVVSYIYQNHSDKSDGVNNYLDQYRKDSFTQVLKQSKQVQLEQTRNRKIEIYVILTVPFIKNRDFMLSPKGLGIQTGLFVNRKNMQHDLAAGVEKLNKLSSQFEHFFRTYAPKKLNEEESLGYCMEIINGYDAPCNKIRVNERPKDEPELGYHYNLREQLINSSYEYSNDYLMVKSMTKKRFIKAIGIERFPSEIGPFSLTNVFEEMNCDFRYLFCYTKTDSKQAKRKLKQRRSLEIGKQTSANQFEVEAEVGVLEENIKEMVGSRGAAFIAGALFIIESQDEISLKQNVDQALIALNEFGDETWAFVDDNFILESHLAFLPGHWRQVQRRGLMLTPHLTYLIPVYKNWAGFVDGECLYKNTSGEMVRFALYNKELKASMGVVTAPTGSGKSFAINDFIKNILSCTNGIVFTLEPGNSYEKINQIFEGEYIVFDSSAKFSLNPFYYRNDFFETESEYDVDALESISLAVQCMISPDQTMDTLQKRIIEEGILKAYSISANEVIPNMSDLVDVFTSWTGPKEENVIARDFALKLKYYTDRKYGKLFNQREAVKVSKRFVSFDIAGIKDPIIQKVAIFCIKNITYNAMKVKGITKYFFLDEVWKLLDDSNKVAEDFIKTIFKMFRKLQGVGYAITQSFDEIGESKAGKTIIQNAEVIISFALKGSDEEQAMRQYGYNERELSAIKQISTSMGYGFFRFGNYRAVLRMQPSSLEYWIYTTDATDLSILRLSLETGTCKDIKESIITCANRYPNGARHLKGLSMESLAVDFNDKGVDENV